MVMRRASIAATLTMLVVSIVACTTQPVEPSAEPTSATVSPSPVPSPTPSPIVLAPDTVVLRMRTYGGLPYPGDTVESPPEFTLYSDGLVIYSSSIHNGTSTTVNIGHAQMTAEQAATLLTSALTEGGLADAKLSYPDAPIFDDGTTEFEIHANGVDKIVSAYALGWEAGVPDVVDRRKLRALAERLRGIRGDVAAGRVEDLGPYSPPAYLLTLDRPIHETAPRPWPWPQLSPADFERDEMGHLAKVVSPADALRFWDPPTSVPLDQVVLGPDGTEYLVRIRPLLPDQVP